MTIDDKEKTPNFGKPLMNHSTVISLPPLKIVGIRGYSEDQYGKHAIFDVFGKDSIKDISSKYKTKYSEDGMKKAEEKAEFGKASHGNSGCLSKYCRNISENTFYL